jgi:hypothetical protein
MAVSEFDCSSRHCVRARRVSKVRRDKIRCADMPARVDMSALSVRVVRAAATCLWLMASVLTAAAQPPDATLKVHTVYIAVDAGYSWGGGVVTFRGKEYPCRIDGLSVGGAGISSADAIGNVYHLTHLEDLSGHYLAVSTGALLAGGGDVATMRNQHGVVIDLTDTSQGAKIMLAVQGVNITLEGAPTASKGQ